MNHPRRHRDVDGSYKSAEEAEFFGNHYAFDVTFRAAIHLR
jgi:hypothetical protein